MAKKLFVLLVVLLTIIMCSAVAIAIDSVFNADQNGIENKTYSWRYKMTVNVETPEGVKSGSAVREVKVRLRAEPRDPRHPFRTEKTLIGEAVVVDLGERGVLYALLSGHSWNDNHADMIVFDVFPGPPGLTPEGLEYYSNLEGKSAVMKPEQYPTMVTFTDPQDPMTVKPVQEWDRNKEKELYLVKDDTQELFGKGVQIKNITIEMTDEPVTRKIFDYLPWLIQLDGGYLHGELTSRGAPLGLYGGNFHKDKRY